MNDRRAEAWSVGGAGRTNLLLDGELVGMLLTADLASLVVDALNRDQAELRLRVAKVAADSPARGATNE